MVATAEPLTTTQDNPLEALSVDDDWINKLQAINVSSTVRAHQNFEPSLASAPSFKRRATGVALTVGMHRGRFIGNESSAELVFEESGRLVLASERAVFTMRQTNRIPEPEPVDVVLEALVLGHVDYLVRAATHVATSYQYGASWRFCLVVADTRDAIAYTSTAIYAFNDGPPYTSDTYERVADASLDEMTHTPETVVDKLVAPLLRGLGSRAKLGS